MSSNYLIGSLTLSATPRVTPKAPSERQPDARRDPLGAETWAIEHASIHIPMNGAMRGSGAILLDGKEVAQTLKCVHCQRTWIPLRGSGKVRGFCKRCMGPVCGLGCAACVPFEHQLELQERAARD